MFTSIKAQFAVYKWAIIFSLIGVLAIGLGWQYHKAEKLEAENITIKADLKEIDTNFTAFQASTKKALDDVATLRVEFAKISADTAALQNQKDELHEISVKPTPGGANSKEIQDKANALSNDVFERIQNSSKGKK